MKSIQYFPDQIVTTITIEGALIGQRLDQVLHLHYKDSSRAKIIKQIKNHWVQVEGHSGKVKPSLKLGSQHRLIVVRKKSLEPVFDKDFELLYEDQDLYVINKPAGAPVHPAGRYQYETITIYMLLEKGMKLYPIHRLDRETSGVLVLAKSPEAAASLGQAMESRKIKKFYLAGHEDPLNFHCIDLKIGMSKDENSQVRLKQSVNAQGSATHTRFHRLDSRHSFIELFTGRQHQIRLAAKSLKIPLVGDRLYGKNASDEEWDRQTKQSLENLKNNIPVPPDDQLRLHCFSMSFTHPETKKQLSFQCFPKWLPEELKRLCKTDNQ